MNISKKDILIKKKEWFLENGFDKDLAERESNYIFPLTDNIDVYEFSEESAQAIASYCDFKLIKRTEVSDDEFFDGVDLEEYEDLSLYKYRLYDLLNGNLGLINEELFESSGEVAVRLETYYEDYEVYYSESHLEELKEHTC